MICRTYDGGVTDETTPNDQALGLRERKKRQSRIAMHRAALELVHEHGLSGVTVEAIAQRAGVSTRTFFNHWTTKESAIIGFILMTLIKGRTPGRNVSFWWQMNCQRQLLLSCPRIA